MTTTGRSQAPPSACAGGAGPSRRRRGKLLLVLGGVAILGLGSWVAMRSLAPPAAAPKSLPLEPPPVDPRITDPLVQRAIEEARTAVAHAPRSAPAWGRLGMVLAAHGASSPACTCFATAERLDPQEPRWPYYQAIYGSEDDPAAILARLQRAVDVGGAAQEPARLRLAETLLVQGRLDEAREQLGTLLAEHPRNAWAHLALARVAFQQGKLQESVEELDQARSDGRTQRAVHLLRCQILEQQGNLRAAAAELRQVSGPEDSSWPDPLLAEVSRLQTGLRIHLSRADRLLSANRATQAIDVLEPLARDYPRSEYVWVLLGRAYFKAGRLEKAETALDRALELDPSSSKAHFHRGVVLYSRKDYAAAADAFGRAVSLQPDFAQAHANRASCLEELGRGEEAIRDLQSAVRCKPDYVDAHIELSELLAQGGDHAGAIEHLKHALRLKPDDARASKLLEKVQHGKPTSDARKDRPAPSSR